VLKEEEKERITDLERELQDLRQKKTEQEFQHQQ
jgi:hypothetical protein